jgi:hypothetical protein
MAKKRTELGIDPAAAAEFRAAMHGVKPLVHAPPVSGRGKPGLAAKRGRPRRAVADDLNELMPLIATTDSGAAASLDDAVAGAAALSFQRVARSSLRQSMQIQFVVDRNEAAFQASHHLNAHAAALKR